MASKTVAERKPIISSGNKKVSTKESSSDVKKEIVKEAPVSAKKSRPIYEETLHFDRSVKNSHIYGNDDLSGIYLSKGIFPKRDNPPEKIKIKLEF